jgi:hypothetical protein
MSTIFYSSPLRRRRHSQYRLSKLLDRLGFMRHPTKSFWQFGHYVGIDIDTTSWHFYAPDNKLLKLSQQAKQLIRRATSNAHWLSMKDLQSLARLAHYLFLAIHAARFFPRELHSVVEKTWGWACPNHTPYAPRSTVMDTSSKSVQRPTNSLSSRDNVHCPAILANTTAHVYFETV